MQFHTPISHNLLQWNNYTHHDLDYFLWAIAWSLVDSFCASAYFEGSGIFTRRELARIISIVPILYNGRLHSFIPWSILLVTENFFSNYLPIQCILAFLERFPSVS